MAQQDAHGPSVIVASGVRTPLGPAQHPNHSPQTDRPPGPPNPPPPSDPPPPNDPPPDDDPSPSWDTPYPSWDAPTRTNR
jgi:hypothetical protein